MSETDFWNCELKEIFNRINGFYAAQRAAQIAEYERARWLSMVLLSVHLKKGQRLRPHDIAIFPWEKQEQEAEKIVLTEEQKQRKFGKMDAFIQKINNDAGEKR